MFSNDINSNDLKLFLSFSINLFFLNREDILPRSFSTEWMVFETPPFLPGFDYGIGFWKRKNALRRASSLLGFLKHGVYGAITVYCATQQAFCPLLGPRSFTSDVLRGCVKRSHS